MLEEKGVIPRSDSRFQLLTLTLILLGILSQRWKKCILEWHIALASLI